MILHCSSNWMAQYGLKNKIQSYQAMMFNKAECVWCHTKRRETHFLLLQFSSYSTAIISPSLPFIYPAHVYCTSLFRGTGRLVGAVYKQRSWSLLPSQWWLRGASESQILLKLLIRHSVIYKPAGSKALCANTSATRVIGQSVYRTADVLTALLFHMRPYLASLISLIG